MPIKKQIENYLKYNAEIAGEILFFDEMPAKKKKNIENVVEDNTYVNMQLTDKKTKNKQEDLVFNQPATLAGENLKLAEKNVENKHTKLENSQTETLLNLAEIQNLDELRLAITDCQCCILGSTRNKLVFGSGNPNADLLVIGEAPGADEDIQGEPFVGRAGQLLTDILRAIRFERSEVYIANICKCRPPGNRRPSLEEVYFCEQYLQKQIEFISPKFILALGLTAADALFKQTHKMADVRGRFLDYRGIKTMITYHPAALLRNPAWKRLVWEDVQLLRQKYDAIIQ